VASWHTVADQLAHRMRYQAHNCPVADNYVELDGTVVHVNNGQISTYTAEEVQNHNKNECAFCQDTAAYEFYLRKVEESRGNVHR
jgi:hypothetical protein